MTFSHICSIWTIFRTTWTTAAHVRPPMSCLIHYITHIPTVLRLGWGGWLESTSMWLLQALYIISPSSYYKRLVLTASKGTQQRFIETMDFFFQAVTQQASDRASGVIPDLESYIALRRDTSGCKPCWALIECKLYILAFLCHGWLTYHRRRCEQS
jgi:hypothetical protein